MRDPALDLTTRTESWWGIDLLWDNGSKGFDKAYETRQLARDAAKGWRGFPHIKHATVIKITKTTTYSRFV